MVGMMAFSRLSARARSASKPCGRSGIGAPSRAAATISRASRRGPSTATGTRRGGASPWRRPCPASRRSRRPGRTRTASAGGGDGPARRNRVRTPRTGVGTSRRPRPWRRTVVRVCVRAEPVGQGQLLGHGVDLGGGQVLAEQSRRLQVVGGAVVVDADDDADTVTVRHRAVEHCESLHAGHSSFGRRVSAFAETYYILGVSAGAWRLS